MTLTGQMLIGDEAVTGTQGLVDPLQAGTGEPLGPRYSGAGLAEVARACALAEAAFDTYRETTPEARARFLEAIAARIAALGAPLIERAMAESGLPRARLEGEGARTVGQLRLFAQVVRDGRWAGVTLDRALPARTPPRPDLRMRNIALGPVAVFGASNFPLAFSVAGGDTASALAAGCPVVVKAHNGHLGTSELVGRAVQAAVRDCGLPAGVFSLLVGVDNAIGEALVRHPAIQAVGFTGSRAGGLSLCAIAASRPLPIPVFAEMSAVNPVFLLPEALQRRGETIARDYVDSLTLGAGQFCTNPGVAVGIEGPALEAFRAQAARALATKDAAVMLTAGIQSAYERGLHRLAHLPGVRAIARGGAASLGGRAQAALFATDAARFIVEPTLAEEVFGPASLVVGCRDAEEMLELARRLDGQLTATLQLEGGDHALARRLLPVLERKAGRVLANGFPTGVEVAYAMVHGGPFPATSDARSTSVGARAIERFLRPVCYQALPADLLPQALREDNPLQLPRLVDGQPDSECHPFKELS
ncbi:MULTISPECIES: aldehyde dehydrogenase (NADP(+)) [Cupriavidus]|uniref:Alpha-ketoglutaric semialdehyde dehydrogenase 2 n=2 Tax=Cupriavidus TaxID=106589 RepID=A0ABN7ZK44_9BURK|nr:MULTISPECIES: aldehyde dehydrogenase (NADP(+)) [Cupriavidus]CAG9166309.1 Alpha-ketoglutaric semialdehyde dehydrogenase 2 [Cupriavidus pinatubonensis]CAG9185370.1 Alpha-ketoglutaric semialdehyde dehydrogenase 2 [Cupriavidus laharis]